MPDLHYNKNYFMTANPNIYDNDTLREPQVAGYYKVYEHFIVKNKHTHAIVVLPTGVGKTGLIGMLPFHICSGRALIITPQLTIKDTVMDSLDPDNVDAFWYKRKVFKNAGDTPILVEYKSGLKGEILNAANIVILNIHKLQARLNSSLLNFLPTDYFDMIIIDEAHHSTANTWIATVEHFNKAKVVKLTGTPIRTDGVKLAGELVYKYKLSQAMAKGYVKSLKNFQYIPDKLLLTIDNNEKEKYTIEEILELGLRDEDWIKRSVAYSRECSESVVDASIKLLNEKRGNSGKVPHKIIAVACSIDHAEQIKTLYKEKGIRAEVIHSKQDIEKQEEIKNDIENNRIDAIINVAMLGEGYDHKYLSIAAIFRPFKSELPYEQFIGRVLRAIPQDEAEKTNDNIAEVISHKNLGLEELWNKYKVEIQESEVIMHLQDENNIDDFTEGGTKTKTDNIVPLGKALEEGSGRLQEDAYLNTQLIKKHQQEQRKQKKDIEELQKLLHIGYEQALTIYNQTRTQETAVMLKRPDIFWATRKKDLDVEIKEIIVPELITKYQIDQNKDDLSACTLFSGKYGWIKSKNTDNGGLLAMYFNSYLKNEIGIPRKDWTLTDYDNAFNKLPVIKEFVERAIIEYLNIKG